MNSERERTHLERECINKETEFLHLDRVYTKKETEKKKDRERRMG